VEKRDVINFLFVLSFPVYGIGSYISAAKSPSTGFIISTSIFAVIALFYCIDLIYKKKFQVRINMIYALMMLFLLSTVASLFIALAKNLPEDTVGITITRSMLVLLPFQAFVIVWLYNSNDEGKVVKLTLISLAALLFLNLAGYYGLGMVNITHTIEGRLSFPFLDAFYSGAGLLAIIDILLLYYLRKVWDNIIWFSVLLIFFMINLMLFQMINSRLATLILMMIFVLMLFKAIRARGVFLVSLFTLPILLSSGLLLYQILKSPALASVMQRVDVEDVTTFHGRSYIWNDAIDWFLYDQRGLLLGNGFKGHYFLNLLPDVVKRWNAPNALYLHLHSTSLEILVNQGLVFYILCCYIFYRTYVYYKQRHKQGDEVGSFLPVVIFLLFITQVDTFTYLDSPGAIIFALMVSRVAISDTFKRTEEIRMQKGIKLSSYQYADKQPVYD